MAHLLIIRLLTTRLMFFFRYFFWSSILFKLFNIKWRTQVLVDPNAAHLSKWTELSSLELVKIMIEFVGTFDKVGLFWLDRQLHFDDHFLFVNQVHQNVFVPLIESVFNSNYFEKRWCRVADPFDLLVDGQDLILFGNTFASH